VQILYEDGAGEAVGIGQIECLTKVGDGAHEQLASVQWFRSVPSAFPVSTQEWIVEKSPEVTWVVFEGTFLSMVSLQHMIPHAFSSGIIAKVNLIPWMRPKVWISNVAADARQKIMHKGLYYVAQDWSKGFGSAYAQMNHARY